MLVKSKEDKISKWDIWEIALSGKKEGNPFCDTEITAEFKYKNRKTQVCGFYDGQGVYKVRFMPDAEGEWQYKITSSDSEKEILGSFVCEGVSDVFRGPLKVADKFHFAYEDGIRYLPIGTTCYAWINQPKELREKTLATLKNSPFNKMRMCVFPKSYDYNNNEPELFPYEKNEECEFDYTRFNPEFFYMLEDGIKKLALMGVEADIILFHPYDRWGFSKMGAKADDLYIKYITARLSAYSNVWWSLANEYDLMAMITKSKDTADWERIAKRIMENDPYGHLRSIHNCFAFYDHTRPWITHCSIQRQDVYKTAEYTNEWREKYQKPIVIDECGYEGNINHGWGNLPGTEMVRRFWEGAVRGGYVGHGETYLNEEEILWWSKGGELVGDSPKRIAFLRDIMEDVPGSGISPIENGMRSWDLPCGGVEGEYYLFYFGFNQPSFRPFRMPEGLNFKVDIIDTWNMTIDELPGEFSGEFRIELPARQYMAVRMRRV